MKYKLKPRGDRVLARRMSEATIRGIHVPEHYKAGSLRGQVVAVGPECDSTKEGDTVIFGKYAPFPCPLDDLEVPPEYRDLLIINEDDLLVDVIWEETNAA